METVFALAICAASGCTTLSATPGQFVTNGDELQALVYKRHGTSAHIRQEMWSGNRCTLAVYYNYRADEWQTLINTSADAFCPNTHGVHGY